MRITIVQGAFLPVPPKLGGGVEKMWFGLAPEFARRGHEVIYISRRFEGLPDEEVLDGVRHIRLPSFDAPLSMLWYRCLDFIYAWRVRFQLPPADILITNTIWLPVLIRDERWGRLCVHVARFPKGQMRLYQHAARLQTVSRAVQTAIAAELPSVAPKVKVIPPYLSSNPPTLTPEELAGPREHWILYLGRIHPEKGLDLLVEAFGRFLAKAPPGEWRLKLVGPSASRMGGGGEKYQASLEAAVAGFRDRVDWLGFVPNDEINALCRRAAIFVYPSVAEKGESFGLAPLEAMALGCPAIVSKLGCFEDFIEDGVTGLVFDHRAADPVSALAERIIDLAHDLPLRQALARRGYAKAQEFTRDKIADRYEEDFRVLKAHADSLPG